MFQCINGSIDYDVEITFLDSCYVTLKKKRKLIFTRHCLIFKKQEINESVVEFLQTLKQLNKVSNLKIREC